MSVVYDATSRTYTVTNGARSLAFTPAQIDAASSTPQITVYKRTSGTTADTLTLTKPGTSGRLTYKYVGAGFWQRTVDGINDVSGVFDAFTYGIKTPDAAMVRTGGASFDVDLLGILADPAILYSLSGSGTLTANFLNGTLTGRNFNGLTYTRSDNPAISFTRNWEFDGTIASNRNAITGTITLNSGSTEPVTGPASGRFYGPGMEELGIAFNANTANILGPISAVGAIIGRKSGNSVAGVNPSLTDLQFDQTFTGAQSGQAAWNSNTSSGTPSVFSSGYLSQQNDYRVRYTLGSRAFSVIDPVNSNATVITTVGTADAGLTDSKFLGYSTTASNEIDRLRMYRIGSDNAELALTYSSFYNLEQITQLSGSSSWVYKNYWAPFGVNTANSAMPTTGSASYNGILYGTAIDGNIGDSTASVGGTIQVGVDFGTAAITGSIRPIITYRSGATLDFGSLSLFNGRYNNPGVNQFGVVGPPTFNAVFGYQRSFGTGPNGPLHNGFVEGFFYGPAYQELTGRWTAEYAPAGTSGVTGRIWGAFGSKKN
jgi:hypothetical protein